MLSWCCVDFLILSEVIVWMCLTIASIISDNPEYRFELFYYHDIVLAKHFAFIEGVWKTRSIAFYHCENFYNCVSRASAIYLNMFIIFFLLLPLDLRSFLVPPFLYFFFLICVFVSMCIFIFWPHGFSSNSYFYYFLFLIQALFSTWNVLLPFDLAPYFRSFTIPI